ncbi:MAG TPA: AraC family transcriptional regulator [Candidatus Xenobia bacterium]|nr:AraC family transcriptional regulator [Candidatus Xenobia bacterium]
MVDERLVNTPTVAIGTFRAHPSHPNFRHAGNITGGPTVVFPRSNVWIQQEGRDRFVADRNIVVFYNLQQPYIRESFKNAGDYCDWFQYSSEVLAAACYAYDRRVAETPDKPFSFAYGPVDSQSYFLERLVFRQICETAHPNLLLVEETMLRVLRRIIENVYRSRGQRSSCNEAMDKRRGAEAVEHARAVLADSFRDSLSLTEIARQVGLSVFHLCRLFRRHCGTTLHQYRNQLRLRLALDLLDGFRHDLTGLALHLGYSSHSHFTAGFHRAFGCTPSEARTIRLSKLRRHLELKTLAAHSRDLESRNSVR